MFIQQVKQYCHYAGYRGLGLFCHFELRFKFKEGSWFELSNRLYQQGV